MRLTQMNPADDADILNMTATVPMHGTATYQRVLQDRRIYYSLTRNGNRTGILTTAKGARETIAYWKTKGWTA